MSKHSNHHVTGIIMSPLLTVICRLPISPLTSPSLQTSVSSVTFCKHQVSQATAAGHTSWLCEA